MKKKVKRNAHTMSKMGSGILTATTPVGAVQKSNFLVKEIAEISKKWHKRWLEIDQPWPVSETLNDLPSDCRTLNNRQFGNI